MKKKWIVIIAVIALVLVSFVIGMKALPKWVYASMQSEWKDAYQTDMEEYYFKTLGYEKDYIECHDWKEFQTLSKNLSEPKVDKNSIRLDSVDGNVHLTRELVVDGTEYVEGFEGEKTGLGQYQFHKHYIMDVTSGERVAESEVSVVGDIRKYSKIQENNSKTENTPILQGEDVKPGIYYLDGDMQNSAYEFYEDGTFSVYDPSGKKSERWNYLSLQYYDGPREEYFTLVYLQYTLGIEGIHHMEGEYLEYDGDAQLGSYRRID